MSTEHNHDRQDGNATDLRQRVDRLEQQLDELASGTSTATDQQGRQWTTADLLDLGLSRREALIVIGGLAAGYTFRKALMSAIGTAEAADAEGDVGVPNDRVDVFADEVDAASVSTGDLDYTPDTPDANTALLNDGYVVSETGEYADPSSSANAIQDVIDNSPTTATIYLPEGTVPITSTTTVGGNQSVWGPSTTIKIDSDNIDALELNDGASNYINIKKIEGNNKASRALVLKNGHKQATVYIGRIVRIGPAGDGGNNGQNAVDIGTAWHVKLHLMNISGVEGKGINHLGTGGNNQIVRAMVDHTGGIGVDFSAQAGTGNYTALHLDDIGDRKEDDTYNDVEGAKINSTGWFFAKAENIGGDGISFNGFSGIAPYIGLNDIDEGGYGRAGVRVSGAGTNMTIGTIAENAPNTNPNWGIFDADTTGSLTILNDAAVSSGVRGGDGTVRFDHSDGVWYQSGNDASFKDGGTYVNSGGTDLTGASDDGTDTSQFHATTISFNQTFQSNPNVVASINRDQSNAVFAGRAEVNNVTTSDFQLIFRQWGTTDHAANNNDIAADWVVVDR